MFDNAPSPPRRRRERRHLEWPYLGTRLAFASKACVFALLLSKMADWLWWKLNKSAAIRFQSRLMRGACMSASRVTSEASDRVPNEREAVGPAQGRADAGNGSVSYLVD